MATIGLVGGRVVAAGCTQHPTGAWVTQQDRNLAWKIEEGALSVRVCEVVRCHVWLGGTKGAMTDRDRGSTVRRP
jgi:hypothetical protein